MNVKVITGYTLPAFLMFFLLFISCFAQSPCDVPSGKKTQKTYNDALDFITKAQDPNSRTPEYFYNQAAPLLREVEKSAPEFAGAHYYLGICYTFRIEKRNLKSAKKYYEKAVELCPEQFYEAYFHLSNIALGDDNFELAFQYIEKYLKYESQIDNDEYLVIAKMIKKDATEKINIFGNSVPFDPVIVKGISSEFDDHSVIISPDHELAFYTRKQKVTGRSTVYASELEYIERIYVSERMPGKDFDKGQEVGFPFNIRLNEGGVTLTIDNREMFFSAAEFVDCENRGGRYPNTDIYYSRYEFGTWTAAVKLPGEVNSQCYWESMPSISSDGQVLYFVSDRPGGYGGYDIYTSERQPDGTWGDPQNLGPVINSQGRENTPFIHTDSQTLYFSSDGHPGLGGYDIFFSRKNTDGTWSKPRNIGYPINTQYDETGFIVSTDGRYGYFSSDRLGLGPGGSDFYSFELYPEARPEKILFIKGEVKDEESNMPVEARVEIKNMETKVVHQVPIDMETGKYVAVLPFQTDYVLTVKKEDYVYESMYIAMEDTVFESPATVDMELQKVEVGKSYKLNDIYYEYDSDALTAQSKLVIYEFVDFLKENPAIKVAIHGHTDNIGGAEYNRHLSERRAKSVYEYLIQLGIAANRLSYEGFGFAKPIATNDTEQGRALNRRTEFVIVEK